VFSRNHGRFAAFAARERALLELCEAEAMVRRRTVSRQEWDRYGTMPIPLEVVDLIALLAQYVLFALTNNVLQVPVEASLAQVTGLAGN